jgi:hypothetical protein
MVVNKGTKKGFNIIPVPKNSLNPVRHLPGCLILFFYMICSCGTPGRIEEFFGPTALLPTLFSGPSITAKYLKLWLHFVTPP